jgi:hypothetical protein
LCDLCTCLSFGCTVSFCRCPAVKFKKPFQLSVFIVKNNWSKNNQFVDWREYQGMASDEGRFSTGLSTDSVEKITTPSQHRHLTVTLIG